MGVAYSFFDDYGEYEMIGHGELLRAGLALKLTYTHLEDVGV